MIKEVEYQIELSSLALEMLAEITDHRHLQKLRERIDQLKFRPEKQGKALIDDLQGYYSVIAVEQRYRIIYKVERSQVIVYIIGVGLRQEGSRKDVYTKIEKSLE